MKIELRPLADIRPYDKNPRLNDDAVDAVAASIREFGFRQPIVVDPDGVIICGHTRFKAAQKLGLEKVPVHVAKDLSPEQIKAYRIADNQTASLADWNYDLLPIELADLQTANFDLGLLGFDADDLARLLDPDGKDGLCDPDDVPAPPDEAITQPGDMWILGDHRLLCGDSANAADVDRLLDGATIHLVSTDPPYNVKVEPRSNNAIAAGLSSFQGTTHHQGLDLARHPEKSKPTQKKLRAKDRPLTNDFVSEEAFDKLLAAWFGNVARVLAPGRGFYIQPPATLLGCCLVAAFQFGQQDGTLFRGAGATHDRMPRARRLLGRWGLRVAIGQQLFRCERTKVLQVRVQGTGQRRAVANTARARVAAAVNATGVAFRQPEPTLQFQIVARQHFQRTDKQPCHETEHHLRQVNREGIRRRRVGLAEFLKSLTPRGDGTGRTIERLGDGAQLLDFGANGGLFVMHRRQTAIDVLHKLS
ncbi:MAG: ParB N-terminal domain-containing protein [Pirellulales bacterium]